MQSINEISELTLNNIKKLNIEANPSEYGVEFCKIAKEYNFFNKECEIYNKSFSSLSREEVNSVNIENVRSIYDIVEILLSRPASHELQRQTLELTKLMDNIDGSFDDALIASGNAYNNIYKLRQNIDLINNEDNLIKLKKKLVNATGIVCKELRDVNKMLLKERQEISLMEEKMKLLQADLDKYKEQSTIDHLTGLLTRRHYEVEVNKFEQSYIRHDEDYAVVFIDIDFFKKINDNYGHDCGDFVLKTFGEILNKLTRKTDILARYGGEEFIAVIKYKQESELKEYLERIKDLITKNKFKYMQTKFNVTFSAGVELRSSHATFESTIKKADDLLYNAKRDGRNKIILWNNKII